MQLKKYQNECLEKLRDYAVECRKHPAEDGARFAFSKFHSEKGYHPFSPENNAPMVCIKVPTGGGKTLIASYSVGVLFETYLKERDDVGLVMWFVPSDAIRMQTLKTLKNRDHPFRKTLDARFDNKVRVFNIDEAKKIKRDDVAENICIAVSTISAFRRKEQEWLKVFQNNGALIGHFEDLPIEAKTFLEKDKSGEIIYSLANVIRLHNPLVIVDEGHNIDTELSLQMLEVLNPSFVLEFTATPRRNSNVLVEVGAQALKDQKMIKMPILLYPVSPWQETVLAGIKKRNELEKSAKKNATGYIRPLMLIQAEQEKESERKIFVEKLNNFLIQEAGISEDEIAVKTAKQDTLPDAEVLADENCKIKYVITVNALREGWDCPFAYILVSVSNLGAAVSVEQTIGRIMRLPYVREHKDTQLNRAYIFASTSNFTETAERVIAALKQNGYDNIISIQGGVTVAAKSYKKIISDKIEIPFINIKNETGKLRKLDYVEDVLGGQKLLKDVPTDIGFTLPEEDSSVMRIDVGHEGQLVKEKGGTYSVQYHPEVNTKENLISWLRFRIQREFIAMQEINGYLNRLFGALLKKIPLEKLSIARYLLKEKIDEAIDLAIDLVAQKHFNLLVKKKLLKTEGEAFEFGDEITLTAISREPFDKHAYEKAADLNREELQFAKKIDSLPNVKWWLRNPENGGFGTQGWKRNKFYPDFIVQTKKGTLFIIEYKGQHLAKGEDSEYKKTLGRKWEQLSDGSFHFEWVERNNTDIVISKISGL